MVHTMFKPYIYLLLEIIEIQNKKQEKNFLKLTEEF